MGTLQSDAKNFNKTQKSIIDQLYTKKIIQYAEINSINSSACVYGDLYTKEFLLKKDFNKLSNEEKRELYKTGLISLRFRLNYLKGPLFKGPFFYSK